MFKLLLEQNDAMHVWMLFFHVYWMSDIMRMHVEKHKILFSMYFPFWIKMHECYLHESIWNYFFFYLKKHETLFSFANAWRHVWDSIWTNVWNSRWDDMNLLFLLIMKKCISSGWYECNECNQFFSEVIVWRPKYINE